MVAYAPDTICLLELPVVDMVGFIIADVHILVELHVEEVAPR